MRRGKPFKMLVIASDHEENCRKIDGIQYVYLPYPRADYIWHDPEMRYTSGGMAYEMQVAEICREFVTTGNQNE